jgi:hypothetical protein
VCSPNRKLHCFLSSLAALTFLCVHPLQGGPKSSGTFVCLRLLRDSSARITVRILRQDKMEIVPKPQPSVRPQVAVCACILLVLSGVKT